MMSNMLLCALVLVAGSYALTMLCSNGCPIKRLGRLVSRKAARQAPRRSKKPQHYSAARRKPCGSGSWLDLALALLGAVWGFFFPGDLQQVTVRGLDGKTIVLQARDRSTMTVGALKAALSTETNVPANKQGLSFPGPNFAELPNDAVLPKSDLLYVLYLKDGLAGGGGGNSKAKQGSAKEEMFLDFGGGSGEEEFAGVGDDGADNQKEVAALKKQLAKRDMKIVALEKEAATRDKKIAVIGEENAILKKKKGSSGSFTTRTGLSDEQVIAILQGDGDKDRTVVAKSVQEQRGEMSEREKMAAEMVVKLLPGGGVPQHTQLWLDEEEDEGYDLDKWRAQAVEPAKWLLEVLKNAYLDERLYDAAVSLLIMPAFTCNLGFLEQYTPLKKGLAEFLRTFGGDRMREIYDDHDLRTSFADAQVRAVLGEETGQRSQAAIMPGLFDGLAFATPIDRFVNSQVALHMLLMVSRAADAPFQQQIRAIADIFAQSATGFHSGRVKQFPRPSKKALTDYAKEAQPRVACNLDPIRCLVAARDSQSMFRVMRALRRVFGPFPKWKNLFAASEDAREKRYHLASIMITVPFELGKTYGELVKDPEVQRMWDQYCETPEGVPLERWRRDTAAARAILASKRMASIPVKIYGEVQLLLESYFKIRHEIHAAYEFLRAASEAALHEEMVLSSGNYTPAPDADDLFIAASCGQRDVAAKLIAAGADVNEAMDTGETPLLVASAQGHVDVVQMLAERGADLNAANDEGATAVFVASDQGHLDVVQLLVGEGARTGSVCNGATELWAASWRGHIDVVRYLLTTPNVEINQFRAKTREKCLVEAYLGTTPLEVAKLEGHAAVVKLLEEHGAV